MVDVVSSLDVLIVVTTAEIRSVAGAKLVIESLKPFCADLRLVIRTTRLASLACEDIVESLGLPLTGLVSTRRAVQRSIDEGLGPTLLVRERRAMRHLLESLPRARQLVSIA
jgi:MinD superfamily P-loop ATPase